MQAIAIICVLFSSMTFGLSATTLCLLEMHIWAGISSIVTGNNGEIFNSCPLDRVTQKNYPITFIQVGIWIYFI
ncbi:hypothetical protein MXB_307, partial [Myxobolus squamalis]